MKVDLSLVERSTLDRLCGNRPHQVSVGYWVSGQAGQGCQDRGIRTGILGQGYQDRVLGQGCQDRGIRTGVSGQGIRTGVSGQGY